MLNRCRIIQGAEVTSGPFYYWVLLSTFVHNPRNHDMKKITFVIFVLLLLPASIKAQGGYNQINKIDHSGFRIYNSNNGKYLSEQELSAILSEYECEEYITAMKMKTASLAMSAAGIGLAAIGTVILVQARNNVISSASSVSQGTRVAALAYTASFFSLAGAVAFQIVGRNKIGSICYSHSSNKADLLIAPTQNGIGLAFIF